MVAAETRTYTIDLQKGTEHVVLRSPLATMDNQAHVFTAQVRDGEAAANLTSAACSAYFIRADGVTVALDGAVSGSTASVTLGANCYAVPGRFEMAMKLTQGDVIHTILRVEGSVTTSRTDEMTGAGTGVTSFEQLAAKVGAFEAGLSRRDRVRNLLDNSDFAQPVNQRGKTVYMQDSGYTIDRWKLHWSGDGSLTVRDGYIELYRAAHQAYLFQHPANVERLVGKPCTLAAKVRYNGYIGWMDSTQRVNTEVLHLGDWTIVTFNFTPMSATSEIGPAAVEIKTDANLSFEVAWIDLYEGTYTAETLPEHMPRSYGEELTECRRYYRHNEFLNCVQVNGQYFSVSTSIEMRAVPGVTIISLAPYGSANVTDFSGCTLTIAESAKGVQRITLATLPTASAHKALGMAVHLSADL